MLGALVRRAAEALGTDPAAFWRPSSPVAGDQDGKNGVDVPPWPEGLAAPDVLGAAHEALLGADRRRALGVHLTPPSLASALVTWAVQGWDGAPIAPDVGRVHDPAVGAGAFLLAAARHQVAAGADPASVLARLSGTDVDPLAVAVARSAVALWAVQQGVDAAGAVAVVGERIVVGDGLLDAPPAGSDGERPDLVVGNPPFLGQLRTDTARTRDDGARLRARLGEAASGYVDSAALFLLAGVRHARPGGRVALIVPLSLLGAEHGAAVRAAVEDVADVAGLWVATEPVFAADVDVGAVLLEVRPAPTIAVGPSRFGRTVLLARGASVEGAGSARAPVGSSWAPLLAAVHGVPPVEIDPSTGTVGDRADVVAGFRQHFYALAPHLAEVPGGSDGSADGPRLVRLVTTGLVDPLHLAWGERSARVAGERWARPGVDLDGVEADDPDVAAWMRARLRPKVLVAPQARVIEAAVDAAGEVLPGVPLVSVEPTLMAAGGFDAGDQELWRLAAALSSPPVTAWVLQRAAGTGRAPATARVSVSTVRAVPLPVAVDVWHRVADDLRAGRPLADAGPDLAVAHGLRADDPVIAWWRGRLPR